MKSDKKRVKKLVKKYCVSHCRAGSIIRIQAGMNIRTVQVAVEANPRFSNADIHKLDKRLQPLEDTLKAIFSTRKVGVDIWPGTKSQARRTQKKHFNIKKLEVQDLPLSSFAE